VLCVLSVGDKILGFTEDGIIAETSVVFIHDHMYPAATIVLHLNDSSYIELTGTVWNNCTLSL
jgi:hypothetical protein